MSPIQVRTGSVTKLKREKSPSLKSHPKYAIPTYNSFKIITKTMANLSNLRTINKSLRPKETR